MNREKCWVRGSFQTIILTAVIFQLHSSEVPTKPAESQPKREMTDSELKEFGYNCSKLPYALWVNTLNFLLGEEHDIMFGIDWQIISDLRQSNKVKVDDCGRLVACYHNNIYTWSPHGQHIAPKKSWYAQNIPQGWSLDRFENGSVVLLNDSHDAITVLDDVTLQQQAHYKLPKNSYFLTANKGRTLVHCAHPLLTKSPILNMQVVTQQDGEKDAKIQQSSQMLRMPQGGVMPPITLDESGTLLAAHATELDEVYVIDLQAAHKSPSLPPQKITLSDHSLSTQGSTTAQWVLKNPATGVHENFRISLRNGFLARTPGSIVNIERIRGSQSAPHAPFEPLYFQQILPTKDATFRAMGELTFIHGTTSKGGRVLISLVVESPTLKPDKNKQIKTHTLQYWDSKTGLCLNSLTLTSKDNGFPKYSAGALGRVALCNDTECHIITPPSDIRLLIETTARGQLSDARVSPSGDWMFYYTHMMSKKSSYVLVVPQIHYFGGQRMKKLTAENPKIDRRKWMMRLYALQQTYWQNLEELLPPRDMQEALGMKFALPHKYDSGSTSKNKDSCIIS